MLKIENSYHFLRFVWICTLVCGFRSRTWQICGCKVSRNQARLVKICAITELWASDLGIPCHGERMQSLSCQVTLHTSNAIISLGRCGKQLTSIKLFNRQTFSVMPFRRNTRILCTIRLPMPLLMTILHSSMGIFDFGFSKTFCRVTAITPKEGTSEWVIVIKRVSFLLSTCSYGRNRWKKRTMHKRSM